MSEIPRRIAALPSEKLALLAKKLKKEGARHGSAQITRRKERGKAQLSFAQERLWFLDQLDPYSAAYNIPSATRLRGSIDLDVLERSLNRIVARHEMLRTTFAAEGGQPVQIIHESFSLPLGLIDLRHLPASEREAQAKAAAREEAQRPFDMEQGPLLRVQLLRLTENEQVLLLTMHHIISDGWSMEIFFDELTKIYTAELKGEEAKLNELSVQYADYAVWQREWLQGEVLEQELGYWRQQLQGAPSVLELPLDRPRPAVQSYRGNRLELRLSAIQTKALKELSRRHDATLFMTLLAAFQVLLHRYTRQSDIVVGTPIANRTRAEVEGLIGFFINTLVIRTHVSEGESFVELLARVKETALAAYAHQDVPFEKLVEELKPQRSLSYNPLFQATIALKNATPGETELPELKRDSLSDDNAPVKFDLMLALLDTGKEIVGSWTYSSDLFDESTMATMLSHFQTLVSEIIAKSAQPLYSLPLLSDVEHQTIVSDWNNTWTEFPRELSVSQLFEQQVERTPNAVAVVHDEQQLTYAELNTRANQLAHHLRSIGAGPETLVGICTERSIEMVVSLLAILKAGGAYVPLDPAYPQERLSFMVEDAGVKVLLTQQHLADGVMAQPLEVILVDADCGEQPAENVELTVGPDNLAYVIYTSGSTGIPKGVCITHRNINRLVCNSDYVRLQPDDVVAQASNASFDAATFEIWGALLNGARLVLVNNDVALSPPELADFLVQQQVSTLFLTTALFNQMIRYQAGAFRGLRQLLFGGEAVDAGCVREALAGGGAQRLLHVYGPTEGTTFSSWQVVQQVGDDDETVPIGRPLANTTLYVLDERMRVMPVGVKGELYIGGEGVGRGYLRRAELTAERFVPDPFSGRGGARLYRTGDEVRWTARGEIEFIGRVDHQVKLRGFRIELGEVEAVLKQHAEVRDSVVVVREERGDRQLVGYLLREAGVELSGSELRSYLKERLPEYMVPSAFVMLEQWPLNPNGKVDRKALPAPEQQRPELDHSFVAPRTHTEERLAGIWCEVLRIRRIGIDDNFFELGGHSLLATQIISRIREVFEVEVPLRSLFEAPTVAGLAQRIETARQQQPAVQAPSLVPVPRDEDLPLSYSQERLWFMDQLEPGTAAYNMPFAARLHGELNLAALERSLNEIMRRHESLRTTFTKIDGRPVQVINEPQWLTLPVTDLRQFPGGERETEARRLAGEESLRPFDLSRGPLLRARLLTLDDDEHVLLLNMHHIVSDGWSMDIFFRELTALYSAFRAGQPSRLAELPIQYADYAVWQRTWLQGDVLEEQLAYWKKQLAGAPSLLELPIDRPRPAVQSYQGKRLHLELSAEVTARLKDLSRREGVTLFMTLLAAFQCLLSRYSGQTDIVVGTDIANRNRAQTEGLIGFFVNQLVLRTDLSGDPTFLEVLQRVYETALGAFAHQDLPFEKLVEELQPERTLSHNPLFQVTFGLQNALGSGVSLPGVALSKFKVDVMSVKFDLILLMADTDQGLVGTLHYNSDIFDEPTMERMLLHLSTLLDAVAADPSLRVSALPLLSATEVNALLLSSSSPHCATPHSSLLPLLAEQVSNSPQSPAVRTETGTLTYLELDRYSNLLAHVLRESDVPAESIVAVLSERSAALLIAMLGIFKAGAAYLPLDPLQPAARVGQVLCGCGARVVLVSATLRPLLEEALAGIADGPRVLLLDDVLGAAEERGIDWQTAPEVVLEPQSLAYVIYTSGSTGVPKGAMVEHGGMLNHLLAKVADLSLSAADRVAQTASQCFDISVWQYLAVLLVGGTVEIVDDEVAHDPRQLLTAVRERGISVWETVPSLLREMLRTEAVGQPLEKLRWLLVTGEALPAELVREWRARHGHVEVMNA